MSSTAKKHKKRIHIPVFIPELACPHRCVFCNQEKITGKINMPEPSSVHDVVKDYTSTVDVNDTYIEIAFFGGNFTGIDNNLQIDFLKEAYKYIQQGIVSGIRISTRPDYITPESLSMLKSYGVKVIELGAQSLNDYVLKKSGRGHTAEEIEKAAVLIKAEGLELGLQMMVGLPGDNFEYAIESAKKIVELKADNTRIYPALVIKDTPMEILYHRGEYKPLSLEDAVNISKECYKIFLEAGVHVHRIGLHPSEGLLSGDELVAGPFHVSFKELVLTALWNELFTPGVNEAKRKKHEVLEIKVPDKEINYAVGYGSANKTNYAAKFKKVFITADGNLNNHEFTINSY